MSDDPGVELPRGATLGRYTIIRRLGAGGMGIVYLAFDPELDRRVAVKLLRVRGSTAGESEGEARLLREAQVMAKLSHPNVITVFDVGTFEGDVFVAMEYVKGETLREWWNWPSRTPLQIVGALVQAGRGLAAAHRQGILHRDFKPENVLVDDQGRARVLDFGLARANVASETTGRFEYDDTLVGRRDGLASPPLTQLGTVLGTPAYMAPEQLVGAPVDARSDQFAFCITAYEALFGDRPFAGATIGEVEAEISAGRIRPPTSRHTVRTTMERLQSGFAGPSSAAPRGVFAVLARGLARKPEDRWKSMDDLLDALERAATTSRRKGAILGGVIATIALASFVVARPSKAPVCTGAAQSLSGVWDAPAREGVVTAFRASGNANADAMIGRVTRALDEYSAQWVAMSTEACAATRIRGEQSDEALDLRTTCLRARLDDVRAFAELLHHADSSLVDNAYGAALKLRPLQACADVQALRAAYEPIGDESKQRAVESLRQETASVTARFNAGRCEEAAPLASALATRARAIDYAPARAEALYASSRVAEACGDPKVAAEVLLQTAVDAQASHQDELVARTLTRLAYVEGSALSRYEEGLDFARLAEAAIRRVGAPDSLLADLAQARGWIEYTRGNLDAALPLRREALARRARTSGDDGPDAIQMRAELADLEYEAGALREALDAERTLLQKSIELLGPGHLRTGRYTLDVAETLVAQGKYSDAAPLLERARPIVGSEVGEHLQFVSAIERFGLGEVDDAANEMTALAAQAAAKLGSDDPAPLSYKGDLAKWLLVHKRTQAALDLARPLVKRMEELRDTSNPWYSNAYAALALGLVRTERASEATAIAEHAVALAEHGAAQLPFALLARAEAANANGAPKDASAAVDRALAMIKARDGIDATILADLEAARAPARQSVSRVRARVRGEKAPHALEILALQSKRVRRAVPRPQLHLGARGARAVAEGLFARVVARGRGSASVEPPPHRDPVLRGGERAGMHVLGGVEGTDVVEARAGVGDDLVRVAVNLEHAHRHARLAERRVLPRVAGEGGDGGDARRSLAGIAVRHEPAVREPGDVDARGVDAVARDRVVEDRVEVRDVVDGERVEVAAGVARVPEAHPLRVARAVGEREVEAVLVGQRLGAERSGDLGVVAAEAVEENEQRRVRVVFRGGVHRVRSRGHE